MSARLSSFIDADGGSAFARRWSSSGKRTRVLARLGTFAFGVAVHRRSLARGRGASSRRVDARSGEPPSLRQTIVLLGAQQGLRWAARQMLPTSVKQVDREELTREIRRAQTQYADDPDAQNAAIAQLYSERHVPVTVTLIPTISRSLFVAAMVRVPIPFLAQRRTLPDLLAGTRMLHSPSRWSRLRSRLRGRDR